jgi:hypothetical protein
MRAADRFDRSKDGAIRAMGSVSNLGEGVMAEAPPKGCISTGGYDPHRLARDC